MTRFLLIFTFLLTNHLTALSLKDKLLDGKVGDYIITEQSRFCSLIRIHTLSPPKLVIEEISFPESALSKNTADWVESGAKGHTSWSLIEINLSNAALERCYSFTKSSWLVPSSDESFLLKILDLPLYPIQEGERRRIGPAPREGVDTRKIWNPPLYLDGKKVSSPQFSPFRLNYPKDGSLLSGKHIELFFHNSDSNFPFPYWGQITDESEAALKFRVVDSGRNLSSPKKSPL